MQTTAAETQEQDAGQRIAACRNAFRHLRCEGGFGALSRNPLLHLGPESSGRSCRRYLDWFLVRIRIGWISALMMFSGDSSKHIGCTWLVFLSADLPQRAGTWKSADVSNHWSNNGSWAECRSTVRQNGGGSDCSMSCSSPHRRLAIRRGWVLTDETMRRTALIGFNSKTLHCKLGATATVRSVLVWSGVASLLAFCLKLPMSHCPSSAQQAEAEAEIRGA